MVNGTLEHVVKNSILCSYVLTQPFGAYVDAYPLLQNKLLLESEQLHYNQHGKSVHILQSKLHKLAYFDDEIDGEFGVLTEHALKKFQTDHQIPINGQADKATLYAIFKVEKENYMKQIEDLSETIYPGMHSQDIKIVQEALNYFGYYEGEIDGIYGPLTDKALKIAEEEHGIELTQEITKEALTTLYETNSKIEVKAKKEAGNPEAEAAKVEEKEDMQEEEDIEATTQTKDTIKKEPKKVDVKANNTDVIQVARSFIGTPYAWGGESPGGFDCSGFIQFVYQTRDITIPRTVSDIWNFSQPVDSPSVGDLVFFSTYKPGPSHMGIYLGDGKFIHAGESRGVEISKLSNAYWQPKYLGAKRIQ